MKFPNKALQFDGTQNYLNLGTLGNFGSNAGSGMYFNFKIKSTQATKGSFGFGAPAMQIIKITFNSSANEASTISGNIGVVIRNRLSNKLLRACTNTPTIDFNDGESHEITIIVLPATNSVSISIDGEAQAITYSEQQTPTEFENLSTKPFLVGALYYNTSVSDYMACIIDEFKVGTSSQNLYGNFGMDEGTGDTTANEIGGTASLVGTPKPTWVLGLDFATPFPSHFRT